MISNEMLSAYIDGELPAAEMDAVRNAIATDELLAARLRQFERVDRMISGFGAAIDEQPLPAAILRRLGTAGAAEPAAAPVVALRPRPVREWRFAMGLAAGLVFALTVVLQFGGGSDVGDTLAEIAVTGPVAATNPLHHALEAVASDQSYVPAEEPGLRITPVLSFVTTRDAVCREFQVDAGAQAARGVACRSDGGWETLRVAAAGADAGGDAYTTASAAPDADFDAFVDSLLQDAPLAAAAEARLMDRGWRTAP